MKALEIIKKIEKEKYPNDSSIVRSNGEFISKLQYMVEAFNVMRELAIKTMSELREADDLPFDDIDKEFEKRMSAGEGKAK